MENNGALPPRKFSSDFALKYKMPTIRLDDAATKKPMTCYACGGAPQIGFPLFANGQDTHTNIRNRSCISKRQQGVSKRAIKEDVIHSNVFVKVIKKPFKRIEGRILYNLVG